MKKRYRSGGEATEGLGTKDLIDKYLDARKSAHLACYALCLGSLVLLGLSRSPAWQLKDPVGFLQLKVEAAAGPESKDGGLPTGYIPVFGPFVICGLAFWYHFAVGRACGLLGDRITKTSRFVIGPLEKELLARPLQPSDAVWERSWATRVVTVVALTLATLCPLVCYGMLVFDFAVHYGFDNPGVQRYYEKRQFWWKGPPAPTTVVKPVTYQGKPGGYPSLEPPWLPGGLIVGGVLSLLLMTDALLHLLDRRWWVGGSVYAAGAWVKKVFAFDQH